LPEDAGHIVHAAMEEESIMTRWLIVLPLVIVLGAPVAVQAQAPNPGTPLNSNPANSYPSNPTNASAANPANPYSPNSASPYASNPANYPTAPGSAARSSSPQDRASQQQSGLTEEQAKTLLQQKGYGNVVDVQPDPNSLWVWQADVVKDGRPTRIGIDYRGNVLDLSSGQAQPCNSPGVRLGTAGGLGVGAQLSQADSCSGR
jgi:hypothetical protein